jgi:1,4-dihydroxy-2-naphthoate octaprenyltransferase
MTETASLKTWAAQVRAPFLVLSVLLCAIGGAVAWSDGVLHGLNLALCMVGVTLAHVAVNLLNELSDAVTGVDDRTEPTPFSGGSKVQQRGLLPRRSVSLAAWGSLAAAGVIGAYLTAVSGVVLAAFVVAGGLASVLYTRYLARVMLGELVAGATLGTCVVLGTYYTQAGALPGHVILLALPPGVLTALLLLLNEFPDRDADLAGGRRHLVIVLGYRGAAMVYSASLVATYAFLAAGVALRWFPTAMLIALLTVPLAVKASVTALRHGDQREPMIPAMGANVMLVLGTDLLMAVAYLIG